MPGAGLPAGVVSAPSRRAAEAETGQGQGQGSDVKGRWLLRGGTDVVVLEDSQLSNWREGRSWPAVHLTANQHLLGSPREASRLFVREWAGKKSISIDTVQASIITSFMLFRGIPETMLRRILMCILFAGPLNVAVT